MRPLQVNVSRLGHMVHQQPPDLNISTVTEQVVRSLHDDHRLCSCEAGVSSSTNKTCEMDTKATSQRTCVLHNMPKIAPQLTVIRRITHQRRVNVSTPLTDLS